MTNQELIQNLKIDQTTGKINFEQYTAMRSSVETLGESGYGEKMLAKLKSAMEGPYRVTQEQMEHIMKTRWPLGRFYRTGDGGTIGCDNSKGEVFVEEFDSEEKCIEWLCDNPDETIVVKGYGEMPKSIYDLPTPPNRKEWLAERVQELEARVLELETVIAAAVMMRTTQKLYFKTRSSEALDGSRRLERGFDLAAAGAMKKEPKDATLFG